MAVSLEARELAAVYSEKDLELAITAQVEMAKEAEGHLNIFKEALALKRNEK